MIKETTGQSAKSSKTHQKAMQRNNKEAMATVENLLPAGSWQRVAAGVAAAAGGGLLAAAVVGVGPAALAGAAGYLAYRGMSGEHKNGERKTAEAGDTRSKH